jgi:hypothetical protein
MNPILRPYGLTVRRTVYDDGAMYIAIVNTSQDTLTSFASQYKPWEIVFFRKAIQEIVLESDEGEVEPSVLVNLREQGTSSDDVKELLRRLEKDQWLAPSRLDPANITLGTRAYLELIGFLSDLGIKKCTICKFEMLQGATCKNYSTSTEEQDQDQEDTCETIVHVTCLTKYQEKGLRFKCPTCKIPLIKK